MDAMVAVPELDLIVAAVWILGLTALIVGQAVFVWLTYRRAARYARQAARLEEATRIGLPPAPVLQLREHGARALAGSTGAPPEDAPARETVG